MSPRGKIVGDKELEEKVAELKRNSFWHHVVIFLQKLQKGKEA